MEPEDQIYVNLEELSSPEKTEASAGSTAVGGDSESGRRFPLRSVCLLLLSFLLTAAVVAVAALYSRDFHQWTADLANHTAERDQLLGRYQNLNHERDQLLGRYQNVNHEKDQLLGRYQNLNRERDQLLGRYQNLNRERDQLQTRLTQVLKDIGTCPSGWKQFGGSCYFFSLTWSSWNSSRQQCLGQRAHLVVINSRQEMVFLNKLGYRLKFWIGLSQTSSSSKWEWTDGRSPEATYWRIGHPLMYLDRRCAVFNSFAAGSSSRTFYSWSSESCTQLMRWVCKKETVPSDL